MSTDSNAPLSIGEIAQRIHLVRGQRVVLDTDLAAFYGETTKRGRSGNSSCIWMYWK